MTGSPFRASPPARLLLSKIFLDSSLNLHLRDIHTTFHPFHISITQTNWIPIIDITFSMWNVERAAKIKMDNTKITNPSFNLSPIFITVQRNDRMWLKLLFKSQLLAWRYRNNHMKTVQLGYFTPSWVQSNTTLNSNMYWQKCYVWNCYK